LSPDELDFRDLGSFEHQFEQLLENLPKEDKFQAYEKIKAEGWCVDWFEELFEDAWSVMAIREPFLDFFKDILDRHLGTDGRHPTPDVRLKVANEILKLMNSEGEMKPPESMEESAAQQILKFMALLSAASYQSGKKEDHSPEMSIALDLRQAFRNIYSESIGIRIGKSISHWSEISLEASNRAGSAVEGAEELIKDLSDQELSDFITVLASTTDDGYQLNTTYYQNLLEGRDYKRLLEFSFFEVDYHNPDDIEIEYPLSSNIRVWISPSNWSSIATLKHEVMDVNSKLSNETIVTEIIKNTSPVKKKYWVVKQLNWNNWHSSGWIKTK
jgi:hypothetical protein